MNGQAEAGRLTGRIALITGASRGIGAAVAKRFAAEGAHVILVARTQAGLEEVDDEIQAIGGTATLTPMDVTEFGDIDKLGAALYERYKRLDVLVGNAGILGTLSPMGHIKPQTWEEVFAVNVTANWRLLRSCDPLLRLSEAGRAMFVTATAARHDRAYFGAYAASKAALESMVKTYALEMSKTAVRTNLIDPHRTRTRLHADAYPGIDPETIKPPEAVTDLFVNLAAAQCDANGELFEADPDLL